MVLFITYIPNSLIYLFIFYNIKYYNSLVGATGASGAAGPAGNGRFYHKYFKLFNLNFYCL